MNGCTVRFQTEAQETTFFDAQGSFEGDDSGFLLHYTIEGDEATLRYRDGTLEMRRKGGTGLSADFTVGNPSRLTILQGGEEGAVGIETKKLEIKKSHGLYSVELDYILDLCEPISFRLTISIALSEVK